MNTDAIKTVFFLGAGFSCAAGAPSQKELLGKVLNYSGNDYGNPIQEYKTKLKKYLRDAFSLDEAKMKNFNLEDFYTPVDKCIAQNLSFRGYSVEHTKKIRNILSTLIAIVIESELSNSQENKTYLDKFVTTILDHKKEKPSTDHVSIITTNWDILLDRRFFLVLKEPGHKGALDYGTFVVGLKEGLIPPLVALTRGMFTIKLLKIHGSLNWLKCPSCNRLFVNPESKVGIPEYDLNLKCRFCAKVYRLETNDYGLDLEPQIIYPTFLKDFSNIHFNQIWEAVATELTEATRIIFIGYSFQQADYEIRQLLSRKVPDNCEIHCVLKQPDLFHTSGGQSLSPVEERYINFFGRRKIRFNYTGVRKFVNDHLPQINFSS
ncbi:MAG: hypothetical protein IPM14_01045 [bacterium]|nr:hypothetical protein [bacterium]